MMRKMKSFADRTLKAAFLVLPQEGKFRGIDQLVLGEEASLGRCVERKDDDDGEGTLTPEENQVNQQQSMRRLLDTMELFFGLVSEDSMLDYGTSRGGHARPREANNWRRRRPRFALYSTWSSRSPERAL
jgi:hypothetical protein